MASRPEVDTTRIVVTGGSQGGGLSLATAALDRRISLCAPDIPFMLDYVRYFKTSKWSEMDAWVENASGKQQGLLIDKYQLLIDDIISKLEKVNATVEVPNPEGFD